MIHHWKRALLLACVGIFCSMNSAEAKAYAQLSSLVNHPLTGSPQPVQINSLDEVNKVRAQVGSSRITIEKDGVYLIVLAGQVGWQGGTTPPTGAYLDLWLRKNGVDVSNSNTRQAIEDIYQTGVLVSQTVTRCKQGDVFEAYINGPSSTIGLVVSAGTYPPETTLPEPTSPSIIISFARL